MPRVTVRFLILPLLLCLGLALVTACEEETPPERGDVDVRQDVRETLDELRTQLDRETTPEIKEELLERCVDALALLRAHNDPQTERMASFCTSLQATDPNTPAAWDDIRRRLTVLIRAFVD